jgi:ABC-type glycerol-3-phosphate transport system substrate-binding protein
MPAVEALMFYVGFADGVKRHYSWNSSLADSIDAFSEGTLAMFIGRASDYKKIQAKNPHLNFDVANIPQLEGRPEVDYGRIFAIGLVKGSTQTEGAAKALYSLTISASSEEEEKIINALVLPPARRDMLSRQASDAVMDVFYNAALISRGWLDPDPKKTENILAKMVQDAVKKIRTPQDAVLYAAQEMRMLVINKSFLPIQ